MIWLIKPSKFRALRDHIKNWQPNIISDLNLFIVIQPPDDYLGDVDVQHNLNGFKSFGNVISMSDMGNLQEELNLLRMYKQNPPKTAEVNLTVASCKGYPEACKECNTAHTCDAKANYDMLTKLINPKLDAITKHLNIAPEPSKFASLSQKQLQYLSMIFNEASKGKLEEDIDVIVQELLNE